MPPVERPGQTDPIHEGDRLLTICNSCRYCEGYCAVFPAMERRTRFPAADLRYLANLCHECGECLYACQYAPPHEFGVNVPAVFSAIREQSYEEYAWPAPLAMAFRKNGAAVAAVAALSVAILVWATRGGRGTFYRAIPHSVMVITFGAVSIFVTIALAMGFLRFWRESGDTILPAAIQDAIRDALTLKYLNGGGEGCTYPDEHRSQARRWFHHFTFYGFLLCFAATIVAAVYHSIFGWVAPYRFFSAPVVLGTLGGLGLLAGPAGLYWLSRGKDPALGKSTLNGPFLAILFFTSLTGFLLLGFRETRAMGLLLGIHLGLVMAFFLALPYGKFVHGIYRSGALLRYAIETRRRQP